MKFNRNNIKLAIIFIVTILVLIWGVNYLKKLDLFQDKKTYYVVYDNIGGLAVSSPVTINGYRIGTVREIKLATKGQQVQVVVKIAIDEEELKIPVNSTAKIVSNSLLGGKEIRLTLSNETNYLSSADTLKSSRELSLSDQVDKFQDKIFGFVTGLDSASASFNKLLAPSNQKAFYAMIEEFTGVAKNMNYFLETKQTAIDSSILHIAGVSESIYKERQQIKSIISNINNLTETLQSTYTQQLVQSISSSSGRIDTLLSSLIAGEGSLGKLIKDTQLYNRMLSVSENLDYLLVDVRKNPSRYVNISLMQGKTAHIVASEVPLQNGIQYAVEYLVAPILSSEDEKMLGGLESIETDELEKGIRYRSKLNSLFLEVYILYQKGINDFTDSRIIAFKNGEELPLEKAIRRSMKK